MLSVSLLGDFRMQSFEAIEKWFSVVILAMNYLQYTLAENYVRTHTHQNLAEMIRQHRLGHLQSLLRRVAEKAHRTGNIEEVVQRFTPLASWAVT